MARRSGRFTRLGARMRSRKVTAVGGLTAVLLGSLGVAGLGHGYPSSRVMLSGGGAWLASASQGLVTLIDGASEQVVGSVAAPGAAKGDALSVVQSGASAYVVDGTQGTVSRVDGATYEASAPVRFGAAGDAPGVYAGSHAVYVVDGGRRLASVTDPDTLRVRRRLSLAARPGAGQSVVDEQGRLWVIDAASGSLTRFDDHGKLTRSDVADPQSQLVLVKGEPVLVDLTRSRLGRVGAAGEVGDWSCLEVHGKDKARLLGSATSARVYAAIPSTGTLVVSLIDRGDCSTAVVVGSQGDDFGPLVEAAGFVFLPNRSTGHTTIVDANAGKVVADVAVARKDANLQLTAKDGFVFYNDLDGDTAGVIRLDGGQWKIGKALSKYSPSGTGRGTLTAAAGDAARNAPPPTNLPDQKPSGGAPARTDDDRTTPQLPHPPNPPHSSGGGNPRNDPPPHSNGPPVISDITWSPDPAVRGKHVTFTAAVANADGATWTWTLLPADGSQPATSSSAGTATFPLPTGHGTDFTIRLELKGRGGTAEPFSRKVTTTTELTPNITDLSPDIANPEVNQKVTFTATETNVGTHGTWSWDVVNLDTGAREKAATPAPAQQPFAYTFHTAGRYRVRLVVEYDGVARERAVDIRVSDLFLLTVNITGARGVVTGDGMTCNGTTCTGHYHAGTQVKLTAEPRFYDVFDRWTQCPAPNGVVCQVTVNQATTLTVNFTPDQLEPWVGSWDRVNPNDPIKELAMVRGGDSGSPNEVSLYVMGSCPQGCGWTRFSVTMHDGAIHAVLGAKGWVLDLTLQNGNLVVKGHSWNNDYAFTETMHHR